jgi:ribosomal protein L40E
MNCFKHERVAAVGMCAVCQKGVCRECVARDTPRIVCRTCVDRGGVLGFEYRSKAAIGGWPLIHICAGVDPITMRPKVAIGGLAIGYFHAMGGAAIAPAIINGTRCDEAAREFFVRWFGSARLPPTCR